MARGGGRLASDEATRRSAALHQPHVAAGTARREARRAGIGEIASQLSELLLADIAPRISGCAEQQRQREVQQAGVSATEQLERGSRPQRGPRTTRRPIGDEAAPSPASMSETPGLGDGRSRGASFTRAARPPEERVTCLRSRGSGSAIAGSRAAPGGADRARDAGDVRAGRHRDRQPGRRDVRGVRLVRDAAAGRLRGPDARAAAGAGGARGHRRGVRVRSARWPRARLARRRRDGARRLRRACSPASSARCWPGRRRRCCWRSSCRSRCRGRSPRSPIAWPAGAWRRWRALLAIALLWPAPARDPVRGAAIAACRALAAPGCARRSPTSSAARRIAAAERDAAIARPTARSRRCTRRSSRRPTARPD